MNGDFIEVFRGDDNQWHWHRKASNGEVVSQGEGYETYDGAVTGAKRANELPCFEIRTL